MTELGRRILRHDEVTSTNDLARELMGRGAEEGTVIVAEHQSAGRGRRGRAWESPPGTGLLLSVILRPQGRLAVAEVVAIACVAVAEAIEEATGLRPDIKWPNDVLIDGKKLCGILVEGEIALGRITNCVLGIGINVNAGPEDLPEPLRLTATSLRIALGKPVDRDNLLTALLRRLETRYREALTNGFELIHALWSERLLWIGEPVRLLDERGEHRGIAQEVDIDGALLVRSDDGILLRFVSGDLSLRPREDPE